MTYKDITIVDDKDNVIGHKPMPDAYADGDIVRIARVILRNSSDQILVQQRGSTIRWPGKWNDSASGHVDEGDDYEDTARKELEEEMGVTEVQLKKLAYFYGTEELNGKRVGRFVTIYYGDFDGEVKPDPVEVASYKWLDIPALEMWMAKHPDEFTLGGLHAFKTYIEAMQVEA